MEGQSVARWRGMELSVIASVIFAGMSAYATLLTPLDGMGIFAWRMLTTLPCALLVVWWRGLGPELLGLLQRVRATPMLWVVWPLMSVLMGLQLWVFMWAPLHGQTLAVSMGYFLLPLAMVLVGRLFYGEHLYRLQWLAVGLALLGALHELWLTKAFAWPTLLVMLGYPPYFLLRKWSRFGPITGFILEISLLAVAAVGILLLLGRDHGWGVVLHPSFWLLLPGLGMFSTAGLLCYLSASRLLPMGLSLIHI